MKGAWQPPPGSFPEVVGVGQLSWGGCSAGLIWKPEGWGRALEKTMGLCVCRGGCVYTSGRREEGEGKGGGGNTAACAGAYVRAGACPGCGEQKTKSLLRFPPG